MTTLKKPLLEKDIQKTISDYLYFSKIFHYRNNSGSMVGNYKGRTRYVQFGVPGMPDIVAVIEGQFVGIEVKRPGGIQSDLQKSFEYQLSRAGGKYLLVTSLDELITKLK